MSKAEATPRLEADGTHRYNPESKPVKANPLARLKVPGVGEIGVVDADGMSVRLVSMFANKWNCTYEAASARIRKEVGDPAKLDSPKLPKRARPARADASKKRARTYRTQEGEVVTIPDDE